VTDETEQEKVFQNLARIIWN